MCPAGMEYRACGPSCHQSCQNIGEEPESYCSVAGCVEGCYCPEGTYFHGRASNPYNFNVSYMYMCKYNVIFTHFIYFADDQCLVAEECPCIVDGAVYPAGTTLYRDCQRWCEKYHRSLILYRKYFKVNSFCLASARVAD